MLSGLIFAGFVSLIVLIALLPLEIRLAADRFDQPIFRDFVGLGTFFWVGAAWILLSALGSVLLYSGAFETAGSTEGILLAAAFSISSLMGGAILLK